MGAAEPLRSVLWVKRQRCAVSLDPARGLLRWWPSPGPGTSVPGAGKCRHRPAAHRGALGQERRGPGGGGGHMGSLGLAAGGLGDSWQGSGVYSLGTG